GAAPRLEGSAVECVAAVLGENVHLRSQVATVCSIIVGQDLVLGNEVVVLEEDGRTGHRGVVDALTVNLEVVGTGTLAVYGEERPVVVAAAHRTCGRASWHIEAQLIQASPNGQVTNSFRRKRVRDLRAAGLHQRSCTANLDHGRSGAYLQANIIHLRLLRNHDFDVGNLRLGEARGLYCKQVVPRRNSGNHEDTCFVCRGCKDLTGFLALGRHACTSNHGSGLVSDRTGD